METAATMSARIAHGVLSGDQPKGLRRLVLAVLALSASEEGAVPFGEADRSRYAVECAMRADRFSRIVRDLEAGGFLDVSGSTLTLDYNGGHTGGQQDSLLPSEQREGVPKGEVGPSEADQVLDLYRDTFAPRWPNDRAPEEERREVRAALKVASLQECKEAILGNKASAYHQGDNDRGKKYNSISHIFRGKRGRKTRREQIDYFIDIYRRARATSGTLKSGVDPALIAARKEEVRRGHRLPDDEEAQERARVAEHWLREQGVETRRRSDGYPVWPTEEGGRNG